MMWALLFAGLFAYALATVLPAPAAATVARVAAVILFGVGLILAVLGLSPV